MNKKPILAGIGELLWDVLPSGKQLGGAPCNFAFHGMQAGCSSFVISAIGNDLLGDEIKQVMHGLGLNDHFVQVNNFPTSTVTVELDEKGHPDYTIHENVAWDHIRWNSELEQLAKIIDAVCFGSLAQRNPESKHAIHSFISALNPDCLKIFDINLRQNYFTKESLFHSIHLADVLKLNEDELPVLSGFLGLKGETANQIDQLIPFFGLKYVIYTMGAGGSMVISAEESSYTGVPAVEVTDTVGAGDAFTAIFTAGILQQVPLKEVHRTATEIAAYVCTQKGATPRLSQPIF